MDERLNQALRTLRAIRQRYETESAAGSGCVRSYMAQVSLDMALAPDISRCELPARSSDRLAQHDATLLVTALEDLQAQRVAIEWLVDADLLCLCVV
jgi:hypothetical protein